MTIPEITLHEQFFKLAGLGKHHEDYERQIFITPFGAFRKEGFVAIIEGLPGALLCLKTDNDYWKGLFYDGEKSVIAFDTEQPQPTKDAKSLVTALFVCLEKREYVERVTYLQAHQKYPQQFAMKENWDKPAHWVGKMD